MIQSALLHFESAAFGIDPGEDEATNPGIFGQPHAVYVACASEEERPGSWAWQLFVFAEGGLLQRLLGTDTRRESMDRVFAAVREALASSPDIRQLTEEPA